MIELVKFDEYESDFTWDDVLHFPVPTINYIKKRTGEDILLHFNTDLEAKGTILAITRTAKMYLFAGRTDILEWEWSIAHSKETLYQVLEYILEFINVAFVTGDYKDLLEIRKAKDYSVALQNAKYALLGARKVIPFRTKFRVGY